METNKEKLKTMAADLLKNATAYRNNIVSREKIINAMLDFYEQATGIEIIESETPQKTRQDEIVDVVSGVTGIPVWKMKHRGRKRVVVNARMIAYELCIELIPHITYEELANYFGRKDHSIISHSRQSFRDAKTLSDPDSLNIVKMYNEAKNILTK